MSKKHVEDYYKQICDDYRELISNLHEMEKEAENGLISPTQIENLERTIEPLKNNYETISWIIYLLNMPNRKSKKKRYEGQTKKQRNNLSGSKSLDSIRNSHREILNKM